MRTIDLSQVQYQKDREAREKEMLENRRKQLAIQGVKKEDIDVLAPNIAFSAITRTKEVIAEAIYQYLDNKFKKEGRIIAPFAVRLKASKINRKVEDAEDVVEFSDEEYNFLKEVFEGDLPVHNDFVLVGEIILT